MRVGGLFFSKVRISCTVDIEAEIYDCVNGPVAVIPGAGRGIGAMIEFIRRGGRLRSPSGHGRQAR